MTAEVLLPVSGIQCPHRGAVFSYHARHVLFPYGEGEREACNIFFVWEMLRPLLKGTLRFCRPSFGERLGRGVGGGAGIKGSFLSFFLYSACGYRL